MEKWKIGVIAVLLLGLVGYGISQQKSGTPQDATVEAMLASNAAMPGVAAPGATAAPTENKAAAFIGQELGGDKIPVWTKVGPWENAKKPVSLDSLKGQPALVEFFRINCSHCQDAAPFLEALYKRYQPRGLKMAAVQSPGDYKDATNEETQWPKVQDFVKAGGLTYPVGMDKDSQYFQQTLDGTYYPTTMITDKTGKVVYAQTGHDTEKSIKLAVELEKQLPGKGTPKERAADLAKFLRPFIFGNGKVDDTLYKSLADDLEQRLMGKV